MISMADSKLDVKRHGRMFQNGVIAPSEALADTELRSSKLIPSCQTAHQPPKAEPEIELLDECCGNRVARSRSDGTLFVGDLAQRHTEICIHTEVKHQGHRMWGLRPGSHSAEELYCAYGYYVTSLAPWSSTQVKALKSLDELLASGPIDDEWFEASARALDVAFFDGRLRGFVRNLRLVEARRTLGPIPETQLGYLGYTERAPLSMVHGISYCSDICVTSFSTIKALQTRKSSIVAILAHEFLHAFANAYRCSGRTCQSFDAMKSGFGLGGHGRLWKQMAVALSVMLRVKLQNFFPYDKDPLGIAISEDSEMRTRKAFKNRFDVAKPETTGTEQRKQ